MKKTSFLQRLRKPKPPTETAAAVTVSGQENTQIVDSLAPELRPTFVAVNQTHPELCKAFYSDKFNFKQINPFALILKAIQDGVSVDLPFFYHLASRSSAYMAFQPLHVEINASWAIAAMCGDVDWLFENYGLKFINLATQHGANKHSVLLYLVVGGQIDIIKRFFKQRLEENRGKDHNHELNYIAAKSASWAICDYLESEFGESPVLSYNRKLTTAHYYAYYGELDRLKKLRSLPDYQDLLFSAIDGTGDLATVRYLLNNRYSLVKQPFQQTQDTVFHITAQKGHGHLLELFIKECKVTPPKTLSKGMNDTAFMRVGMGGDRNSFKLLYPYYKAEKNIKQQLAEIAMNAVSGNHLEFFSQFIHEFGKELLSFTDAAGWKLSHHVLYSANIFTIRKMLTEFQIDLTEQNAQGEIALLTLAKGAAEQPYDISWQLLNTVLTEFNDQHDNKLHLIPGQVGVTLEHIITSCDKRSFFPTLWPPEKQNVDTLLKLPADLFIIIAQHLRSTDWLNMHLTCVRLHTIFRRPEFWRFALIHFQWLDNYTFEHRDFSQLHFRHEGLLKSLFKTQYALARPRRYGMQPWQLLALSGDTEQLTATYGKVLINRLQDENTFNVRDYLILGGHIEAVIAWITEHDRGFDATKDPQYRLPQLAINAERIKMLQRLCTQYKYDLTNPQATLTLLRAAAEHNQFNMLLWLNLNGIRINEHANELALITAEKGFWDIFRYCIKFVKTEDKNFWSKIAAFAIQHKELEFAIAIIQKHSLSARDFNDPSRFFRATILSDKIEYFERGITARWGQVSDTFEASRTPLHFAAEMGKLGFLRNCATQYKDELSVSDLDSQGNTLLHLAAKQGNWHKFLSVFKNYFKVSDLFTKNKVGETVAHIAAKNLHLNLLYMLHKTFGDNVLAVVDNAGNTLLHTATNVAAENIAIWLIESRKLDPAACNNAKQTPLHILASLARTQANLWHSFKQIAVHVDQRILTDYQDQNGNSIEQIMQSAQQHDLLASLNALRLNPSFSNK